MLGLLALCGSLPANPLFRLLQGNICQLLDLFFSDYSGNPKTSMGLVDCIFEMKTGNPSERSLPYSFPRDVRFLLCAMFNQQCQYT